MRRIALTLGSLAAAGVLALSVPGFAVAAQGTLTIVPTVYENPSGCYNGQIWPLIVQNGTDTVAVVHDGPDCSGSVIGEVAPGDTGTFEFGASVSIA
ncbi:hypothetical protein GPA10_14410 [Streptomyces sp. p1417]|uniref:Secreted protein n=1 Tax=Streptomyces typhae TaxID=2681492 RepID=A0A6L6WXC8_9ACTN|nr:hypothetical protein [Streptomyces typhae]MVO85916.1 hypothetical protein [Streptomyces typhae]